MVFQHFTVPGSPLPGTNIVIRNPIRGNRYPTLDLVPANLHLDDTEIQLTGTHIGDAISSEWSKRTLLCQWLEATGLDSQYKYIIIDCPPATKIVSQNAIALSHGYIVPVVPEAVMERGAPHLVNLIQTGINANLARLAAHVTPPPTYVANTQLVGLVITRIQTSGGSSGYTNDHTTHLNELRRRWGRDLLTPYIVSGTGISESLTLGLPVYDTEYTRSGQLTQNVGERGLAEQYRKLTANLKSRIDRL
jgi:chromosome partitioning protein